ncbi:alpha/beta hydrolase [Actinoplanes sp. NPDC049596]|uniref:alpha/beta fold hydrolase n=1 Tax=unclassified Actinoplanes TaxID=2626549 RepID=UPI003447D8AE
MSEEIFFEVDGGTVAALDHGGAGHPVLLVHGSGHNAAAWEAVVAGLLPRHRVIAVDLRGHGHSTAESRTAEQYWRDLAVVVTASGWERPLLVGHSTGGYAVTAVTAAGLVEPSGICIVDGLVLDDRQTAARALGQLRTTQAAEDLRRTFGYGRRFDAAQRDAWIEKQAADAPTDWLNAGADPELVRAVGARSFLSDGGGVFTRRPTTEEIAATTTAPADAPVYPSVDVYDGITCPMTIVLARHGFYSDRRDEVTTIVKTTPQRRLVEIASGHNIVMTHPQQLTAAIAAMTA